MTEDKKPEDEHENNGNAVPPDLVILEEYHSCKQRLPE